MQMEEYSALKFWHMPQPGWNLWANIQPYLQTCLIFKLQNDLFFLIEEKSA